MKKRRGTLLNAWCLFVGFLLLLVCQSALADVSPGDVVDKTNWQKVEGLVPEACLLQVKNGNLKINVGELAFDPYDYLREHIRESTKAKEDKYYVDDEGTIREKGTKQIPKTYIGIPFPEIDPKDPKAGYKVVHNLYWTRYSLDGLKFDQRMGWVGKKGLEKTIENRVTAGHFVSPRWANVPNPEGIEVAGINVITAPYDVAGTAILMWTRAGAEDANFAYVPAIRRCRRTSPAARSDSMFGSDLTMDDLGVDLTTIEEATWKYLGTKEALVPYMAPDKPVRLFQQEDGSYKVDTSNYVGAKFGFEVDGWDGAPWAVTNWTWVKRKVHVVEATPKNKYYNASKMQTWYDTSTHIVYTKTVWDRTGKMWKFLMTGMLAVSSDDRSFSGIDGNGGLFVYDMLSEHATVNWGTHETTSTEFHLPVRPQDYTLTGFVKHCK